MPFESRKHSISLAAGLLVVFSLSLSACGLQPALIDEPEPTATPVTANVPGVEKDQPSKGTPQAGAEPTLAPGEFTYANGVPFPVPSTQANAIPITTMEEAWGANIKMDTYPTLFNQNDEFRLVAVDEDGRFLVGEVNLSAVANASSEVSNLSIMDLPTGGVSPIPGSAWGDAGYYVRGSAVVNGDWIAWLMGSADGETSKLTIKAYNRVTASVVDIPLKPTVDNIVPDFRSLLPSLSSNSVDHNMVVWAEASGEIVKGKLASVIKSYNLDTGETTEIGRYGLRPVIYWPYVAWLETDLGSAIEGEYNVTIVVHNLQTGENRTLGTNYSIRELAIYDDTIGYTAGISGILENMAQTRRQIITPYGFAQVWRLTLNDRLAASLGTNAPAVWDRKLEEVVRLTGFTSSSQGNFGTCVVNGHTLAWQSGPKLDVTNPITPPTDVKIYVVDTNSLP